MVSPSRVLLGAKKLSAITSKRGNKNFYKGRGAKSIGYRTPHGRATHQPAHYSTLLRSRTSHSRSLALHTSPAQCAHCVAAVC